MHDRVYLHHVEDLLCNDTNIKAYISEGDDSSVLSLLLGFSPKSFFLKFSGDNSFSKKQRSSRVLKDDPGKRLTPYGIIVEIEDKCESLT
ncbi:hypothetical protein BRARA_F02503 [Brassica rapa]|uniref:Uncharacterized protein n=1 Tax=Brassica campestris TaxID=3711 RepID=A0A397Z1C8_BRACM|nr:hypothetical protein BRARA_F02503 [Brassica rapa]